ncbi:RNA-directed DNA polymerase, eukaryota [Tanacetum coccineum]
METLHLSFNRAVEAECRLTKKKVIILGFGIRGSMFQKRCGRLTLLKSVLGSTPIYNMSIFKGPETFLQDGKPRRNYSMALMILPIARLGLVIGLYTRFLEGSPLDPGDLSLYQVLFPLQFCIRYREIKDRLSTLVAFLGFVILSNSNDRWVSDLNGDGVFRVKDVRNLLDEFFLPRADIPTRWVKNIPIKVNIFAWKLALDRLPTRANLVQRNVVTESQSCPLCDAILEDTSHLFFNCSLARDVTRLLCRWWNLGVQSFSS